MKAPSPRASLWLAAGLIAVAAPVLLLLPDGAPRPKAAIAVVAPIRLRPVPPLDPGRAGTLFETSSEAAIDPDAGDADAPALVGIVGRLPDDAVALVRAENGRTQTIRVGDRIDGWRLSALAVDAAFFTRDTERVRVALPPVQ